MNVTAILNVLLIAGAVHGFIFNIATFLARKKIEKPVLFLNLLVFFLSMNNLQSWLIAKGFVFNHFFLKNLVLPWYVLILPMFYAFLIHYLGIEKKRLPFLKLSVFIFISELIARCIFLYYIGIGTIEDGLIPFYNALEDAVTLLYSIFIFAKSVQLIFTYPELYSDILTYDDLLWVKRFLKWGGIIFLLWGAAVVLNIFSDTIKAPHSYYPLRIASSVLIYWIGYQAFFRYTILKDRIVLRKEMRKKQVVRTEDNSLKVSTLAGKQEEFNQIHKHIVAEQRYFDPLLSLDKLADELQMSAGKLSTLINQFSGRNFSDYINSLRVEDAKRLLKNPDFDTYTIVSIGLECGFNSKSTFYTAFKKFTNKTPITYKKEVSN